MSEARDYATVLAAILNGYAPVSDASVMTVMDSGSLCSIDKGGILFPEKRYNAFEYFQLEGISRRFNTDEDMQEISTCIYQERAVITPHFARTKNGHSIFTLQVLTACTYLQVPVGAFDALRRSNHEFRLFGQRVVGREFIRSLRYEVLFRSSSARDRLMYFRQHYPYWKI